MNKKVFTRILLCALVLSLALSATAYAAVSYGVIKTVNKESSVNLRSGAGTRYPIVGWGYYGDELQIIKDGRTWDRVRLLKNGTSGYMFDKYVIKLITGSDVSNWGDMAHVKTKYASSTVNLRKGPGTKYDTVGKLNSNDKLAVLDKVGSWYYVQVVPTRKSGYIHKNYLTNGVAAVTNADVNLRKKGSNSGAVIRTVPLGTDITVLTVGKKWSKVKVSGKTGYMFNQYFALR